MTPDRTYTLDELCTLVDLPKRTIRYYMQIGLGDRPDGLNRGAKYLTRHLEQLLAIRTKPADFNLDTYLESGAFGWLPGPVIHLEAAFTAEVVAHLEETPLADDQTMTPLPDGRVKVTATVRDTQQLRWWLQGFGDAVEVLSPPALRQQQTETAQCLAGRYDREEP